MNPAARECLVEFARSRHRRKRRKRDLLRCLGVVNGSDWALAELKVAQQSRDSDAVEFSLMAAFIFGYTADFLVPLTGLCLEDWHFSHENIVTMLGEIADPGTVGLLYRMTSWVPEYLDFDDSRALAHKAIHALGKIESPQAVEALLDVRASGPLLLRGVADRRLQDKGLADA